MSMLDVQLYIHQALQKAILSIYESEVLPAIPVDPNNTIDPANAFDAFIVLTQVCGC